MHVWRPYTSSCLKTLLRYSTIFYVITRLLGRKCFLCCAVLLQMVLFIYECVICDPESLLCLFCLGGSYWQSVARIWNQVCQMLSLGNRQVYTHVLGAFVQLAWKTNCLGPEILKRVQGMKRLLLPIRCHLATRENVRCTFVQPAPVWQVSVTRYWTQLCKLGLHGHAPVFNSSRRD